MKLLTPSQIKTAKDIDVAREILRNKEYDEAAERSRKNLARAEADFASALAWQKEKWAFEEKEHAKRVIEMTQEIDILEAKRHKALEPIELIQNRADNELREARELLISVKTREDEVEEMKELLENRLDSVGERETNVVMKEAKAESLLKGAQQQQEMVQNQSSHLSQSMLLFSQEKASAEADMQKRKNELFLMERSLIAQKELVEKDRKSLEKWETRLKDREGLLKRNLERISPYKNGKK